MLKIIYKIFLLSILSSMLFACAITARTAVTSPPPAKPMSPAQFSELQQGKRFFDQGYYRHAMHTLLPLACDCVPEAQYAVGYMYYYGYGVAQDTDVGYFWIKRAADQHYAPAIQALKMIAHDKTDPPLSKIK